MTGIYAKGNLYITQQRDRVNFEIPLDQLRDSIDKLDISTNLLLDAKRLETETELIIDQIGSDLTILTGLRDAKLLNDFCNSVGLRAIDLSDLLQLSWNDGLSSLITSSTLSLINDNVFCTGKGISKNNQGCFLWINLLAKNTQRESFISLQDMKTKLSKTLERPAYISFNKTHIFISNKNTGKSGCIGDRQPKTHTDSIKDGLRVSFYNSIGKTIHKKIEYMRDDMDKIFLSLIELSTVNLIDPTLKVTKMDESELRRMTLSLIPVEMTRCAGNSRDSITSGILVGYNNYTLQSTEITFWKKITNLINMDKFIMRSEMIRTYISTLNLHRSIKRRINNLQISYGAPKIQIEQPLKILWSPETKLGDLICFCELILSKSCASSTVEQIFHLLNRDKMAAKRDILYSLNLDPKDFAFPDLHLNRKIRRDETINLNDNQPITYTEPNIEINIIQNDEPVNHNILKMNDILFQNPEFKGETTTKIWSYEDITTTRPPVTDDTLDQTSPPQISSEHFNMLTSTLRHDQTERDVTQANFQDDEQQNMFSTSNLPSDLFDYNAEHLTPEISDERELTSSASTTLSSARDTTTSASEITEYKLDIPNSIITSSPSTATPTTQATSLRPSITSPTAATTTTTTTTTITPKIMNTTRRPRTTRRSTSTTTLRKTTSIALSTTRRSTRRTTTQRSRWETSTPQKVTTSWRPSIPNSWNHITQERKKRSFLSYWLSAGTGLAEQTELNSLKEFENDLLIREQSLAKSFGNFTVSENILKSDIRNISDILLKSLSDEQVINEKLSELINTQMSGDKQTNKILSILDTGLKKNNKLTQIFAELLFLQKSLDKVKKWIDNVIAGKIDIFDIELSTAIRNLGSNGLRSLQLAKSEIIWTKSSFTIQFTVKHLSEPFQIFGIKSLPTNMDANTNNMGSYLNVDSEIAISSNGDYIFGKDFSKCSKIEDNIFCNHLETEIHTDGKNCCEVNLVHNF